MNALELNIFHDPHYTPVLKGHYDSVYRHDYIKREGEKPKRFSVKQEFEDPISESYRKFLTVEEPHTLLEENHKDYFPKFKENYPKIAETCLQHPVNEDVLQKDHLKMGRSTYTVDYCDIEKDDEYYKNLANQNKIELPDDYKIPETTYLKNFKDPSSFLGDNSLRSYLMPVLPTLGVHKCMDMMKTGESEYQDKIGTLAGHIVANQLHGKLVHPQCSCLEHNLSRKYNSNA